MSADRVVIDASLAVKWVIVEKGTEEANALRKSWIRARTVLMAPEFLLIEVHNTLWKKIRRGEISREAPVFSFSPDLNLPLDWIQDRTLLPRASTLALDYGVTIYDGLYAAAAEQFGCPLHTADAELERLLRGSPIQVSCFTTS